MTLILSSNLAYFINVLETIKKLLKINSRQPKKCIFSGQFFAAGATFTVFEINLLVDLIGCSNAVHFRQNYFVKRDIDKITAHIALNLPVRKAEKIAEL